MFYKIGPCCQVRLWVKKILTAVHVLIGALKKILASKIESFTVTISSLKVLLGMFHTVFILL